MSVTLKTVLVALVSLSITASPVLADLPDGKGKPDKAWKKTEKQDRNKNKKGDDALTVSLERAGITATEARRLARDYRYTGYKSLPKGIQKKLARGKPLPPGIAKKMVPSRMLGHLPLHVGYEWRVAGSDLILVSMATDVVADVLSGVFR